MSYFVGRNGEKFVFECFIIRLTSLFIIHYLFSEGLVTLAGTIEVPLIRTNTFYMDPNALDLYLSQLDFFCSPFKIYLGLVFS